MLPDNAYKGIYDKDLDRQDVEDLHAVLVALVTAATRSRQFDTPPGTGAGRVFQAVEDSTRAATALARAALLISASHGDLQGLHDAVAARLLQEIRSD